VFDLMQHYLSNGASAYVYWNMVLESTGRSTWGWRQNSLFSVDPHNGQLLENPEYWLMRHVAGAVRPGDSVVQTLGRWGAQALGFRKRNGQNVIVLQNPRPDSQTVRIDLGDRLVAIDLPQKSFATLTA
jgi:glucosylceramidase